MATLEATQRTQSGRNRFRAGLLAVGVILAIGAAALIVALSGTNSGTNPHPAIGAQARPYVPAAGPRSSAPPGYFRDPATHRLTHVSPPAAATQSTRSRRPTLQSVLQSLTPAERQHVRGIIALSKSHQAAAFGTVPLQSAAVQLGLHPGGIGNGSNR
jgi:hypothetical protein